MAAARSDGIYIVPTDGSVSCRIVRVNSPIAPEWSADGKLIAFSDETGVFVVRPDGGGMRKLSSLRTSRSVKWSTLRSSPNDVLETGFRPTAQAFLDTDH